MRRQQYGSWNGDPDLGGERVVKKFLVSAPQKRIVDHGSAGEGRILQKRAIERDVLRDAIDDYVVAARLSLNHFVDPDRFRGDLFAAGLLIDAIDECPGKRVLLAK